MKVRSIEQLNKAVVDRAPRIVVEAGVYPVGRALAVQHECDYVQRPGARITEGTLWFTERSGASTVRLDDGSLIEPSRPDHKGGVRVQSDRVVLRGGMAIDRSRKLHPETPSYASDYPSEDRKPAHKQFGLLWQGGDDGQVRGFRCRNFWFGAGTGFTVRNLDWDDVVAYDSYEHSFYFGHFYDLKLRRLKGLGAGQLGVKFQTAELTPDHSVGLDLEDLLCVSRYTGLFVNQITGLTDRRFKNLHMKNVHLVRQDGGARLHPAMDIEATDGLRIEGLYQHGFAHDVRLTKCTEEQIEDYVDVVEGGELDTTITKKRL